MRGRRLRLGHEPAGGGRQQGAREQSQGCNSFEFEAASHQLSFFSRKLHSPRGLARPLVLIFLALSLTEVAPLFVVFKEWGAMPPTRRSLAARPASSPHGTHDNETVKPPHLLQDFEKQVAPPWTGQQRLPVMATGGDGVEMSAAVEATQARGHGDSLG